MLEARDLMVFYENMLALNNVTIRCEAEEIVGVFGANSAGKSTLMYAISGIMEDIRKKEEMAGGERITILGTITYLGQEITRVKPSKRAKMGIILCPERRRIFKESSVLENLRIGAYLASPSQARETMDYVFTIFPALQKLKKRVGGFLSGGEQQMLAIGRALMAQPKVLLLDEPLLGLSPLIQAILVRTTKEIRDEKKISIVITEQYARPVLPIIDYGFILENGAAVLEGTREELLGNPDVRSAYFGV
ncbi:MAG: ATP-binding cassette domain-containing protein [Deltaproteobacteria bacterium]|mgnify:CR=1 FL=1|nr:ATP-binding cassette domain-containing protein [Deltaproteobacteria bacterium]MBW1930611.1 ATP-binding cassette domain-containing protein [Deltaproteobacteria bacterium]MBW2025730.1 ATP-binding cassette domain-containing protein [Deltaproteobacteria bacterium]MBW2124271.1 ATP-binding cassette domain-containing protein [Deltaproteobacteria bacterium]RLB23531.1 MAG: ABC transporter ATP-binding protein [Deltaproteobacteria bacterium]